MTVPTGTLALVPVIKKPAGKKDNRRHRDGSNSARDALIVKGAAQADLAAVNRHVQNTGTKLARLAPHAFVANIGNLADHWATDGNYDSSLHHDRL